MSDTQLYVRYTITQDPTLPPNAFRWSLTAPPESSGDFSLELVDSTGASRGVLYASVGYPPAYSSVDGLAGYPGKSLTARLNVKGGKSPDLVVTLDFPTELSSALNQKVVSFVLSTRVFAADGGARPLAELDPNGSPVVLSYDVPEPTSYRGRQLVQLDFPPSYFVSTPATPAPTPAGGAAAVTVHRGPTDVAGTGRLPGGPLLQSSLTYSDDEPLTGSTVPADRAGAAQLTDDGIGKAFTVAKSTGYFDPAVFPNVSSGNDASTRAAVIQALADLDVTTVVTQFKAGNRLAVYRDTSGRATYRFIPAPRTGAPTLLLVEYYRLSSYPARYGAGRTIKTFSLLPGERTRIRVSSYRRTTESATRSASILDSTNDETESEFEQTVQGEQSSQNDTSRAFEYHADVKAEAKATWGWGSANVTADGGVSGTSNVAREEFAKNVSTAVAQHAARASSRRDVQVDTSLDSKIELGEETAIERELENVNVSRTLNFVFRQMNQEFVTVLHLVDIRVAFFNGFAESRTEVSLPELGSLLQTYIVPERRAAVQAAIAAELSHITDYTGAVRADFVKQTALSGAEGSTPMSFLRVDPNASSSYRSGGDGPVVNVPGVIVSADSHVMRTDGVVVDTFLGLGNGLDEYSTGLQVQEVRRQQIDNDIRQAELDRVRLGLSLVTEGNAAGVELFQKVFPATRSGAHVDRPADSAN